MTEDSEETKPLVLNLWLMTHVRKLQSTNNKESTIRKHEIDS